MMGIDKVGVACDQELSACCCCIAQSSGSSCAGVDFAHNETRQLIKFSLNTFQKCHVTHTLLCRWAWMGLAMACHFAHHGNTAQIMKFSMKEKYKV